MSLRLEYRLWFWATVGPALLLVTALLCSPLLLLAACGALALGTLLDWRGLLAGMGLLAVVAFFELHHTHHLWWHIFLVCSLALSVGVGAFSFRQVTDEFCGLQVESRTHLQRSLHLEEEYKQAAAARQLAQEELAQIEQARAREERLEGVKLAELEALEAEREELVGQVRSQRAALAQVESPAPDGHWRERTLDLEERLEEVSVALAESRGKEMDTAELRDLRAQVDVLRDQLLQAQRRAYDTVGLRESLNELRVDRYQLRLDLERREPQQDLELEVLELEQIVAGLLSELQKRSTPMLAAIKK